MDIREHQRALRERYQAGDGALQTITVRSGVSDLADPLHCAQTPDSVPTTTWRSGAHPAVGGEGDVPCSVDLLLAALAACQETTLRLVAANHGIELTAVDVVAEADWDPRGTLGMGRDYPIGLTGIHSPFTYVNNPDTATYWLILIFIWQYLGFAVIIVQSSFRTSELSPE